MNRKSYLVSRLIHGCVLLLLCGAGGCGAQSHDRYVPRTTVAQNALETALSAWKNGEPYKEIKTAKPAVQPFDARWQAGKKLEEFEILKELPAEGPKQFLVRMKVEGDAEPREVIYHVVGIDPIHVFGDADYKKASGQ